MGLPLAKFTFDDFLAWEAEQTERHEFIDGEVFAMVGARRVHGIVNGNVFASLKSQLRGTPCRAFFEGMLLKVADDAAFYPDVFVTCDRGDLSTERVFTAPTVIVEVLSPGTQGFDRGRKFAHYRRLASLREYLLVDPDTRDVELYRRGDDGRFTLYDLTGAPQVDLASIGCALAAADVFEGLEEDPQMSLSGLG